MYSTAIKCLDGKTSVSYPPLFHNLDGSHTEALSEPVLILSNYNSLDSFKTTGLSITLYLCSHDETIVKSAAIVVIVLHYVIEIIIDI